MYSSMNVIFVGI